MSKEVKYELISGVGMTIAMTMSMASGALMSNALFFGSLVIIALTQLWTCKQEYKRGYEDGKNFAGYALSSIDTCFAHREREMRLKIQQDLKERGIEVDLIEKKKKYKYYA